MSQEGVVSCGADVCHKHQVKGMPRCQYSVEDPSEAGPEPMARTGIKILLDWNPCCIPTSRTKGHSLLPSPAHYPLAFPPIHAVISIVSPAWHCIALYCKWKVGRCAVCVTCHPGRSWQWWSVAGPDWAPRPRLAPSLSGHSRRAPAAPTARWPRPAATPAPHFQSSPCHCGN